MTDACAFWPRCDAVPTVAVTEGERYCRRHAIWVADKETRLAVLARDRGRCRSCGVEGNSLDWAHVVPRAPYTRWDLDAAVMLCRDCHHRFTLLRTAWAQWVADNLGRDHYQALRLREHLAERRGGHVDLAAVIQRSRAALLAPAESARWKGGAW